MIRKLLIRYADEIPFDVETTFKKEELIIGLEVVACSTLNVIGFLLIFGLSGYLEEGFVFISIFCWFRGYIGGVHMNTQLKCLILMIVFASCSIWIQQYLGIRSLEWISGVGGLCVVFRLNQSTYSTKCKMVGLVISILALSGCSIAVIGIMSLICTCITKIWEVVSYGKMGVESDYKTR